MDTHKALSTDNPLSRCLLVLFSLLLTLLTVAELTLVVLLQLKVCVIKDHSCELLYDISIQQYFLFKEVEITPLVSIGVKQTVSFFIWIICITHRMLLAKIMVR